MVGCPVESAMPRVGTSPSNCVLRCSLVAAAADARVTKAAAVCALAVGLLMGCRSESSSASGDPKPMHAASAQRPSGSAERLGQTERPRLVFQRDDIDTIRMAGTRSGVIEMVKREGHWQLTSPPPVASVNTEAIERLLTNLEEVEFVERLRTEDQEFAVHIAVSGNRTGRQRVSFRGRARPYQQVLCFDATGDCWVVRGVAPWIAFAGREDFTGRSGAK